MAWWIKNLHRLRSLVRCRFDPQPSMQHRLQLWLRFKPWSGNFHGLPVQPLENKTNKQTQLLLKQQSKAFLSCLPAFSSSSMVACRLSGETGTVKDKDLAMRGFQKVSPRDALL